MAGSEAGNIVLLALPHVHVVFLGHGVELGIGGRSELGGQSLGNLIGDLHGRLVGEGEVGEGGVAQERGQIFSDGLGVGEAFLGCDLLEGGRVGSGGAGIVCGGHGGVVSVCESVVDGLNVGGILVRILVAVQVVIPGVLIAGGEGGGKSHSH